MSKEEYEPSPIIPIGDKNYLCVEYPGYVKRPKRAIVTLGGEKALAEALANNTTVKLKYRPGDVFSHAVQGHITPNSKLVVKVTRKVKRDKYTGEIIKESSEKWKTEIIGNVTKTLRFRALADFQYIVPEDDKIRQLRHALVQGDVQHIMNYKMATDDDKLEDLRGIPPPMFTPTDGPLHYGYRQNLPVVRVRVRQPDGSFKIKLLNKSREVGFKVTAVKYFEENAPTKSWHNLPQLKKPAEIETTELIRKLFEERPIWSRYGITSRLASNYHPFIRTALTHNAYTFVDGPWRDCWVVYGKDPRKEPDCYLYQIIDVRRTFAPEPKQPARFKKSQKHELASSSTETADKIVGPTNKHIFDGKSIPGTMSSYQLIDIVDPELTRMIYNEDYRRSTPKKDGGYYYKCVLDRIRRSVRTKHISLAETGSAEPMPNVEDGLSDLVAKEKERETQGIEDEDEEEDTNMAETTDAVKKAMETMETPEKGKRLKDVVDDYMSELVKGGDRNENVDDADDIDILEEYDEEEFDFVNGGGEEEEVDDEPSVSVKVEQEDNDKPQDVIMEEPQQ